MAIRTIILSSFQIASIHGGDYSAGKLSTLKNCIVLLRTSVLGENIAARIDKSSR